MKSVITKENVGLLLNGVRGLVINDIEKVKILNDFFSVFTHKTFGSPRPLRQKAKSESKEVEQDQVKEHLNKVDTSP